MGFPAKKIEAVPTPADVLRKAVATLQAEQQKAATLLADNEKLRLLDSGVDQAQAAVDALAAAHTKAFQEWATAGGNGERPVMDERATREVAQRLESALRERQSAQAAMRTIETQYGEQVATVKAAETAVNVAAADVLGPAAIEKYQRYREAVLELSVTEQEVSSMCARLITLALPNAQPYAKELNEKFQCDRIPQKELMEQRQRGVALEESRWAALMRGEV